MACGSPGPSPARGARPALGRRLLVSALGLYLNLCRRTARWELVGADRLDALARRPEGFVMAFWHECLPLMPMAWSVFWDGLKGSVPRKPGLVLVSHSRDGAMIGTLLARFGLTPVAGSSSRGGKAAAIDLLRGLRQGAVAVVVPDGPRGPRCSVSAGGLRLAAMAGVPIVPCGAQGRPVWRVGSWDRMMIPLPFARCVAVVGAPILHADDEPADSLSHRLSGALDAAMAEAGAVVGQAGPEAAAPAPTPASRT